MDIKKSVVDWSAFIDISPKIGVATPVFPGDVPFSRDVSFDFSRGDHMTLSSIRSTLHIGAHADAPIHYDKKGESIDTRSLSYYMGLCQIVEAKAVLGEKLIPDDIRSKEIKAPRVIFKTDSFNHNSWNDNFNSLSSALIEQLADQGVCLVGIDTPSIDPPDSKELSGHSLVAKKNMAILEGLDLSQAKEGLYQLIALPLKIEGADASPVRAILLDVVDL